jgi:hypothetical protein
MKKPPKNNHGEPIMKAAAGVDRVDAMTGGGHPHERISLLLGGTGSEGAAMASKKLVRNKPDPAIKLFSNLNETEKFPAIMSRSSSRP